VSDWQRGPYLAAMLLTSPAVRDPIEAIETDAGTTRIITGIVTHAAVPRLGQRVEVNLLLLLFAGRMETSSRLVISVEDPHLDVLALPPVTLDWNGAAEPTRYVLPLVITPLSEGTYWITAKLGVRLLSRVPLTVEVLPAIPNAFRQLAD
jgi:hypothetical protein